MNQKLVLWCARFKPSFNQMRLAFTVFDNRCAVEGDQMAIAIAKGVIVFRFRIGNKQCVRAGVRKLVIIAKAISDRALGLLVQNNQAKTIQRADTHYHPTPLIPPIQLSSG